MIPTNSAFVVLYIIYVIVLILSILGLWFKNTKEFAIHLFVYLLYTALMASIFNNEDYFKYGGSLAILFYGYLFPAIHFVIYGIIKIVKLTIKH